jgi:monoamine oxidase
MPHLTRTDLDAPTSIPPDADIVVVGAGMAGLYVTWRLLRDDPERRICILDKLDRTGGRLDSDVIHFPDADVKEEEGGMRFTFDLMDDLMSLLLMLGLDDEVVPFPMASGGNNRLHFRGHAFTNAQSLADDSAVWGELYDLAPAERGVNPRTMIDTVFNRILAENPQFTQRPDLRTPEFWQSFRLDCSWGGICLKDWTLWGLLDAMGYSNECITLLYRLLGFNGTFLSEMNAGEAFQLLEDFPAEPQFKTLENGFSSLPNALVAAIGELGGADIFLDTTVDRIAADDDGYRVAHTTRTHGGDTVTGEVEAPVVVLALPRLALEQLYISSDVLNQFDGQGAKHLWNTLQTTTDQALLKINLYYPKAWWGTQFSGETPVDFGPNFSDLPLGTVYPFYAIEPAVFAAAEYEAWLAAHDERPSDEIRARLDQIAADKYDKPAALTIYCDYLNINFWRALQQSGALFDSPMQQHASASDPQTIYPASVGVVEAATRLFATLFNTHYVPPPVLTSARIWSGPTSFGVGPAEQFGYGVHQWGLHADDRQAISDLVEPRGGLFTCGEAFSDYQGWVEGALRSADLVLDRGFGLDPISVEYQRDTGVTSSEAIKEAYGARAVEVIREYIDPDFDHGSLALSRHAAPSAFNGQLTYF